MSAEELKATTYWSKPYKVEAIRINEHNIKEIAAAVGGDYSEEPNAFSGDRHTPVPRITLMTSMAFIGDWAVLRGEEWEFYEDEHFLRGFWTHAEEMSENEKYAKIFRLVRSAMVEQDAATYHQDQSGMDLVTIETVKKIIGEL
jgi:hypothetical protein